LSEGCRFKVINQVSHSVFFNDFMIGLVLKTRRAD